MRQYIINYSPTGGHWLFLVHRLSIPPVVNLVVFGYRVVLTVSISESLLRLLGSTRTLSETVSLGDSLTRQLGLSRLISEAIVVSEGLTR